MSRSFHIPHDPAVDKEIAAALAAGPVEPDTPKLPKPTPMELLQRWKISAAAAQSPANRDAKIERRWLSPLTPRQREERLTAREDR